MHTNAQSACSSNLHAPGQQALQPAEAYTRLVSRLAPIRAELLSHPLYQLLREPGLLRVFMASHVFAVWDFMTLLKSLQHRVTCVYLPWLPPHDADAARLINEIVLDEETDEVEPGCFLSHFELYIRAMHEVGADTVPIRRFVTALRVGEPIERVLGPLPIPESTKTFVLTTMDLSTRSTHEVAASFLLGREDVIPAMFGRILHEMERVRGQRCEALRFYLERHMLVDEERHAPRARRLLQMLCGTDPALWEQAFLAAVRSIRARVSLWGGIRS